VTQDDTLAQDDALARACAETMFARDAASQALGMTIEEARAGYARVAGDRLVAEAEERSSKGRTGVYDVTVTRGEGELVAVFRGVCYRVKGTVLEGSGT
jgi:acyl-CoA thioesterase